MELIYKSEMGEVILKGVGNEHFNICLVEGLDLIEKERELQSYTGEDGMFEKSSRYTMRIINIAGDFNSWSSTDTPLKQAKDGSFSVKLALEADKEYQFRYLLDGYKWENDWKADKYIPAPYSNADNSVVVTKKTSK